MAYLLFLKQKFEELDDLTKLLRFYVPRLLRTEVRHRILAISLDGVFGPLLRLDLRLEIGSLKLCLEPGHFLHIALGKFLEPHLVGIEDRHLLIFLMDRPLKLVQLRNELAALTLQSLLVKGQALVFFLLVRVMDLSLRVGRLEPGLDRLAHDNLTCFQIFDHLGEHRVLRLELDDFFPHFVGYTVFVLYVTLLL